MSGIFTPEESLAKGHDLLRSGLQQAALEQFANAYERDPADPRFRSYYGWAVALIERRIDRGLSLCRSALRDDYDNPEAYCNLAKVLLAFGRKSEALRYLRRGLMVAPTHPLLIREWRNLGVRKRPILPFLSRQHLLNRFLGRVRGRIGGVQMGPRLAA